MALIDIMMPRMTGITLFQHMRERHPDLAIVFLTAVDDLSIAVDHIKSGALDYIVKPVTQAKMREVVDKALENRKNHGEEGDTGQRDSNGQVLEILESISKVDRKKAHQLAAIEGTVSIMFTDLEGSTELLTSLGDEEVQELLRTHNNIIRHQVDQHGGLEVKSMGDGFMVVFSSAKSAVARAIDIQRGLNEFSRQNTDRQLKVRIGINVGETIKENDDFFGSAVIIAARLTAQASGGQILVSEIFRKLAGITSRIQYKDRGWKKLKGFAEEEHLYEIDWRAK